MCRGGTAGSCLATCPAPSRRLTVPHLQWYAEHRVDTQWPGCSCSPEVAAQWAAKLQELRQAVAAEVALIRQQQPDLPHLAERLPLQGCSPVPDSHAFSEAELRLDVEHPVPQTVAPRDGYHRGDAMGLLAA